MNHTFLVIVLVLDVVLALGGWLYMAPGRYSIAAGGVLVAVLNILALLVVLGQVHV